MKAAALLLAATLAAASPAAAQGSCPAPDRLVGSGAEARDPLWRAVRYLADDALEGRRAGTAGERCAAEYIAAEFRRLGLHPGGSGGSYYQEVGLASAANPPADAGTGRNVVGVLPGTDPALREETIVIGAHYDHLGREVTFSMARDSVNAIHNGADDNASGVAAMLHAAERLAAAPPARTVVFVAFTGEELGLLGSADFVRDPANEIGRARAMLNMDMVGRLGAGPLVVYGVGTAAEWPAIVAAAGERAGIRVAQQPDGYGASDHTSFYVADVPVLHFFTNSHGDYHRPGDDWQKVDYPGLRRVAAMVADVAAGIASRRPALTLVRTPRPSAMGSSGSGAYLGTVPDFAPVERGVRLSGVTAGSPGAAAGLRAGDVLVRLGSREIADLQGFTDALRAHQPGDRVRVAVIREGREVTLEAVLGSRN